MLTRATSARVCLCLMLAVPSGPLSDAAGVSPASALPIAPPRWVGDRVRVNGVPLELRMAGVPIDRERLTERLTSLWSGEGRDRDTSSSSPIPLAARLTVERGVERTVIGRQRGPLHEVISLRDAPAGGTSILISVLDASRPVAAPPRLPFRSPPGLRILSVIEQDGPGAATTIVADAPGGYARTAPQLRDALQRSGWVLRAAPSAAVAPVLWAERGGQRLDAVLMRRGAGTRAVIQVSTDVR